ncbi:PLDc N-terminal domain-containing protein [Microdochium nivale]|nr:PLDc N-terminal domain-containing protein [Microdochium nivale]
MLQNYYLSLFLQLLLAVFAYAAPIADEISATAADPWQYGTGGGIIGFIVLVLDILVWIEVLKSNRPVSHKLLWAVLVFIFPIGGIVIYWLFSNRSAHNSGGYEPL